MGLIVQKFGGSSVADADRVKNVARRVVATHAAGHRLVVVVSAPGDMTDDLVEMARRITDHPPAREMDMLLATGEQVSIALLAMAIHALGREAISLTGGQARIRTERVHTRARIVDVDRRRIDQELAADRIVIVAGFQGITDDAEITTLGRGGSDTTAVALASALGADLCQIYTDVEGVFTADPRVVPAARKLREISYDEMLEMASSGALVLQTRAAELAKQYRVPLEVRSSFVDREGTMVTDSSMERRRVVTGITHDRKVAKITATGVGDRPGAAHTIFRAVAARHVNVNMIIQSVPRRERADISFTVGAADMIAAVEAVRAVAAEVGAEDVLADDQVAMVSAVGAGMVSNPGVAARMFGALATAGINIELIATSEIKVSCVIRAADVERAVQALHREFELERE
ncbi:MAG TPA: aspartate kinase [bacterium]|nr:aspartate kinase [bacterium]